MFLRSRQVLSTFHKLHFHTKSKSIVISDSVQSSLKNGDPIVALESTIITHGMPQPHNLNTAKKVESIIHEKVCTLDLKRIHSTYSHSVLSLEGVQGVHAPTDF